MMMRMMNSNNFGPLDEESATLRRLFGLKKLAVIVVAATCGAAGLILKNQESATSASPEAILLRSSTSDCQGFCEADRGTHTDSQLCGTGFMAALCGGCAFCPSSDGPVVSSSTFAITNNSPETFGCSTVYVGEGKKVKQSIKYFGNSCGREGCNTEGGQTSQHTLNGVRGQIGIQWNLSRLGSDGATCDNPCRQLNVDLSTCTYSLVTSGFCYEPPRDTPYKKITWDAKDTPRWTPDIDGSFVNGVCTFTVTENSKVDSDSEELCGCNNGAQPCNCGDKSSDMSMCQGVCPADVSIGPGMCIGPACTCYV